jgi:hypothetical protein
VVCGLETGVIPKLTSNIQMKEEQEKVIKTGECKHKQELPFQVAVH